MNKKTLNAIMMYTLTGGIFLDEDMGTIFRPIKENQTNDSYKDEMINFLVMINMNEV